MTQRILLSAILLLTALFSNVTTAQEAAPTLTVNKETRTVTIPCKVAVRQLPNLKEIYPIEVIATHPAPQGLKAHETVVVFDVKPSEIHKALESLGLKPGKPAKGEGAKATGPEVKISLEIMGNDGKPKVMAIEKALVDRKTGKPMPTLKWYFTGSVMKQPDPNKPEEHYGADLSGTLIAIFPVTDETVFQTNMTMKEEPLLKLETNKKVLPAEGTPVKLIVEAK